MKKEVAVLAILAAILIGAGAARAEPAAALGSNLAGEACRMDAAPSLVKNANIICGEAVAGTARMSAAPQLPADAAARLNALMDGARALRGQDAEQASCGAAQWVAPGMALSVCTITGNGWPHIVLAAATANSLYEADGMPSLLPVLTAVLARLAGGDAAAATDAGEKILAAKLPADMMRARASDAADYKNYVEAGRLAGGSEDYVAAENAYRHALDIETKLFGPDAAPVGETLAELALQVSNQGRFDEADALFHRAEPILESAAETSLRARLSSYLALHAANQRHFDDALKLAHQATTALRAAVAEAGDNETDAANAQGELSHSLRLEAEMALRLGDVTAARASAEEALWIVFQQPGLPLWWRADTLALMGEVNEASGRVVPAEHNFKDAADLDKKLFGDTAPTASAQLQLGAFYASEQIYQPALAAYREAFRIFAADKIARSHVVADQLLPYFDAANAQAKSAALENEMFEAAQLAGGGVTDQTIARMAARQTAGTPALAAAVRAVQDAERARDTARIELAAENSKADQDRDAKRVQSLQAELAAASSKYDTLAAKLAQSFPDYGKLAAPGPAALADVQRNLAPDAALVMYVVGVKGSYALLVKPDGLIVRKIAATSEDISGDVADLRKAFAPTLGRVAPFSLKSSYALYGKLIAPFEADLSNTKMLTVVPSPELANLPFALLVSASPAANESYSDAAWLIRRMAVSNVPSPRAFLALASAVRKPAPDPILAFGAPDFTGNGGAALQSLASACLDGGPVAAGTLLALPPLPDTAGEVNAVAHALGAGADSVLLGAQASEAALHARNLSDYNVIYFATHGLLPGELHCQSEPAIALSPPAHATSTDTDGMLTAGEVANLDLNADLVVLSACNTAAGGNGKSGGAALEGLADAFFDAGARAVLASHWQVPSASTVSLMTDMFARYGEHRGQGLAEALRQAQLALIAKPSTAHPFNWAAFTLIGDGQTAAFQQSAKADVP
jgi:CHAT domain-containing protein